MATVSHRISVLDGSLDVFGLLGTVFYAGYGSDVKTMLDNRQYAAIYTLR